MADILIHMEMPKYTTKAEFGIDADGNPLCMVYHEDGTEPDIYDVVPLPKGHGRLIDADALLEQIRDGFEKAEQWRDAVENDPEIRPRAEATVVAFWECGAKVKMAPTIVPAEGGGEDG